MLEIEEFEELDRLGFSHWTVELLDPQAQVGPDGWPYLWTRKISEEKTNTSPEQTDKFENVANLLKWLATRGIGLVIQPEAQAVESAAASDASIVLTYGMVWSWLQRGQLAATSPFSSAHPALNTTESSGAEKFYLQPQQQLHTGIPTESYLPSFVKRVIKQFLTDQGIFNSKILMVSSNQGQSFDLAFSLESLGNPPASEHSGILEALAWFLPIDYSLLITSEKNIPGFQQL